MLSNSTKEGSHIYLKAICSILNSEVAVLPGVQKTTTIRRKMRYSAFIRPELAKLKFKPNFKLPDLPFLSSTFVELEICSSLPAFTANLYLYLLNELLKMLMLVSKRTP